MINIIINDATQRQNYNSMFKYLTKCNRIMNKNELQTRAFREKVAYNAIFQLN